MPFPAGASTITVTGTFPVPVAGTARAGQVVFTPSAVLVDSTQHAIYSGGGPVDLDTNGHFSTTLLCTDDTDVQPTGWRWRVDEQPAGGQRRTYWIALPSTLGATVDLSTLSPVSEPDGSGSSLPPSGPAGGALTGSYPNPQLSSATIATFDTAGAASAAQAAAQNYTNTVAATKAALAHAAQHAAGGSDPVALTQAQITGLVSALAALAPLAGAHFTGDVTVDGYTTLQGGQFNSDFAAFGSMTLIGAGKRVRFRPTGGDIDVEGGGKDVYVSVWSGEDFTGAQHTYLRLEYNAGIAHAVGTWVFGDSPFSTVHTIDPAAGTASFGAKNGLANIRLCGRLTAPGAPTTGAWTAGDAVQDSAGAWWLCTAGGTPGTWSGGSGGAVVRANDVRVTAGDVALAAAASWTIVTSGATPLSCAVKAAVGDRIHVSAAFMRTGSAAYLDLATLTSGGAISRYFGSGTSSPLAEGNPAYYPQSSSFPGAPGTMQMVVASGEVDGSGKVTVALVYKGPGPETIYASATYPFYLLLTNLGPEPA
ncbi:hypothetical protein ACFWIO_19150 [Streptomyces diastatochromogenes]|uniref:hypothetical protein n=1 Tax=Streptomyces diastatochromogenes TaxID=42236 RepID=UPI00365D0539